MYNLLSANISRLWLNRAFWVTLLFMAMIECSFAYILLDQNSTRVDLILFASLQVVGILISIFYSLFLGTEYNDGTIRNKLIVGHKRETIYLASFITGTVAVTIIYFIWGLIGGIFTLVSHASVNITISQIMLIGLAYWLACISYIAIFNFIGMISSYKARTSIICILTAFILMFAGLLCYSLARPGFLPQYQVTIFQFLFDFNPYGQIFQTMSVDTITLWKLCAYALSLITLISGLGIYIFRKKDLK